MLKEPVSPCLGICRLDPAMQYCVGCFRTIGELSQWTALSREEKQALIEELDQRRRDGMPPAAKTQ